jgi:predicted TIM-barrel fold metal-dependent hydrolase
MRTEGRCVAGRVLVVDADSHKCENPAVFFDYLPAGVRERIRLARDRFGEQRFCLMDRRPGTGERFERVFLQPEGYGKGTFRPYHAETTLGGLFNRVRIEHMQREGIDHQVIYGSVALAFNSLLDPELAVALCRAYNDYIRDDCARHADVLHPVGFLALQDPAEAVRELRRCVGELGMPAVCLPPNLPAPHPQAPERFPEIRVPKPLSHADFWPLYAEAERLDVALGVHGAPGMQLAGGSSDQLDSFTLVHVFANRSMQQMALAKLIFDGVFEAFPRLRFGFLEAGAGWLPDLMHSLHEHWEKRIVRFDPSVEPSKREFLWHFVRERDARGDFALLRKARRLISTLERGGEPEATPEELHAFRHEHPKLVRDPLAYLARGQIFLTVEPDDPAPVYLGTALGEAGTRVAGMAIDYGHWDATLAGCVARVAGQPGIDPELAARVLGTNALDFYGSRLRERIAKSRLPQSA